MFHILSSPLSSVSAEKTFRECFLSWFFLWHLLWLSVMQLRHYFFIGTLNPMLQHLTHGEPSLGKTLTRTDPLSRVTSRNETKNSSLQVVSGLSLCPCVVAVSQYINAFAITQLCGVLCAPWNGLLMDRHKGKPRAPGRTFELTFLTTLHS